MKTLQLSHPRHGRLLTASPVQNQRRQRYAAQLTVVFFPARTITPCKRVVGKTRALVPINSVCVVLLWMMMIAICRDLLRLPRQRKRPKQRHFNNKSPNTTYLHLWELPANRAWTNKFSLSVCLYCSSCFGRVLLSYDCDSWRVLISFSHFRIRAITGLVWSGNVFHLRIGPVRCSSFEPSLACPRNALATATRAARTFTRTSSDLFFLQFIFHCPLLPVSLWPRGHEPCFQQRSSYYVSLGLGI